MSTQRWATQVSAVAIAGQALAYLLGVVLARNLEVSAFETYVVASAAFILMVAFVPQGLEKYALRVVPPLLERARWPPLAGYIRFSIRRTLWAAWLVGTAVGLWAVFAGDFSANGRAAMLIGCATLPAGAMVHWGLEMLTAVQRPVLATIIFKIVVPAVALASAAAVLRLGGRLDGAAAVACWSFAWTVALVLMAWRLHAALPGALWSAQPEASPAEWAAQARPFWVYRALLAVFAQVGVLVLDRLQPSPTTVGAFAVAAATAGLAQVLATATNRGHASRLSLLLDRQDVDGIRRLKRERLRWLLPPLLAYVAVAFMFSKELIGLFRPAFIDEGVTPLRILVLATALSVVCALSPTYAKFRGKRGRIYASVAVAAAVQLALLLALVPTQGATGAAVAYAIGTAVLYGRLAWLAHRDLAALEAAPRG